VFAASSALRTGAGSWLSSTRSSAARPEATGNKATIKRHSLAFMEKETTAAPGKQWEFRGLLFRRISDVR
jgi:hypothetical protein